jgi:hypothetical protein
VVDQEKSNRRMTIWAIVVLVIIIPIALSILGQFYVPPEDDGWDLLYVVVGWLYFFGLPWAVYHVFEDKAPATFGSMMLMTVSVLIGWVLILIAICIIQVSNYLIFDLVKRVVGGLLQSMAQVDVRGVFVDLH